MPAILSPSAKQQFFTNAGALAAGYKLYTRNAGSGSLEATYTNRAGTVPNTNPIILDARGECVIYLTPGTVYDYELRTDQDVLEWTREDVIADAGDSNAVAFSDTLATAYLKTVSDMLNGAPVALTRFIDPTKHSAIRANTSTYDAADDVNDAFQNYNNFIVPAGRYSIGSTLLLPDRTTLRGDGWSVPLSSGVPGTPQGSVFRLLPGADCDVFRQAAKATRYSLRLFDIAVDGDGSNQTSVPTPDGTYNMYQFDRNAFFFESLYNAVFNNLFWTNMRGAGLALHGDASAGMTNVFIENCHGYNCRTYNIYMEGTTTDVRIAGGDFGFGRVANARLTSSVTVADAVFWTSQCQDISDPNTHLNGSGAVINGGVLLAGNNNKIIGGRVEGNAGHGIRIVGDDNEINGVTLYFNSSTVSTDGLFDGINVASSADNVVIQGCDIRQSASSPRALRKAIRLESGHSNARIVGGSLRRVGASAAQVPYPVQGLDQGVGDTSDFSWGATKVRASQNASQSIGTGLTKVNFQLEAEDTRNEWNTTNSEFTAGEAGYYRVEASVGVTAADGNNLSVSVVKNGVEVRRFSGQRAGSAGTIISSLSFDLYLAVGDVVQIQAIANPSANSVTGSAITWVEITQTRGP